MKVLLLIAVFYIAINVALLGVVGFASGLPAARPIAIHRHGAPPRTHEEMGLDVLLETVNLRTSERPHLVVLGASGVAWGYPPPAVQARLPGFTTSNLGLPGATISELLRVFDEVLWATPPAVLRESVLVVGVSYMMFCSDPVRYAANGAGRAAWWARKNTVTNVDKAAARSPLILDISHPLRRVLPRSLVLAAKQRLRIWKTLNDVPSLHPGDWLARRGTWRFQTTAMRRERERREATASTPGGQSHLERFLALPVERQVEYFLNRTLTNGTLLDQRQFDNLSLLLDRATSAGMTVVLVHVPLHSEHRRHAPWLPEYRAMLGDAIAKHGDRGRVYVLDLTSSLPNGAFIDLAHADPDHTDAWVDLLADSLLPFLPHQPSRSRE